MDARSWYSWIIQFGFMGSAFGKAVWMLRIIPTVVVILLSSITTGGMAQSTFPKIRWELPIVDVDSTDLYQLMADFAEDEGFTINDVGSRLSPWHGRKLFYVRMIRSGIEVLVDDFLEQNKLFIAIYDFGAHPTKFEAVVKKLDKSLRNRWPDKLQPYTGD